MRSIVLARCCHRPKGEYYWVTGLLLCQKAHLATTEQEKQERMRRGDLPIGTIAELAGAAMGVPVTLGGLGNAEIENLKTIESAQYFAGNSEETHIFALELQRVVLTKKKKLDYRYEGPNHKRMLGSYSGSTDGSDVEEDLMVDAFDEGGWDRFFEKDNKTEGENEHSTADCA